MVLHTRHSESGYTFTALRSALFACHPCNLVPRKRGEPMQRRTILTGVGSSIAGLSVGATLLNSGTQTAQASVSMGDLSIGSAETTTNDGTINDVKANVSGRWNYDVPEGKKPKLWQTALWVLKDGERGLVGLDEGESIYLKNDGDWSINGSLLATELYSAEDFAAPKDSPQEVDLSFELAFNLFNDSETLLATAKITDSATATVHNRNYIAEDHGDVGGSGEIVIVG